MVSDFIDEVRQSFLEYGESKEGYWTHDKFMEQIKRVVDMAELKYPSQDGCRHVWVFDHSSCHAAMLQGR